MTGGPWHCGMPMRAGAGYQMGGSNDWMAFRCETCMHQQTVWGHVVRENGVEKFVAQPPRVLTVLMCKTPNGVLCRGISKDVDIFGNLLYTTVDNAVQTIGKHFTQRGFRCVFDLPKEAP